MSRNININNMDMDIELLKESEILYEMPKFQKSKKRRKFDDGTSLKQNTKKRKSKYNK